jgi:hypothetical protein
VPGSVVHPSNYGNTPPSGIHYGAAAAPTTLGASAGEVQPKRGKAGFIIAGVLVVAAAGAGIAIVMTGKDVPANSGSAAASGSDPSTGSAGSSQIATPGSNERTVDKGSAGSAVTPPPPNTGSAGSAGSAAPQVGSAGSGSAVVEEPKLSTITLTTTPAGAEIFVDGVDQNKKTPAPFDVPRDKHAVTITLKLDRYEDVVLRNFSVDANVTDTLPAMKKKSGGTGRVPGAGNKGNTGNTGNKGGSGRRDDSGLERPE